MTNPLLSRCRVLIIEDEMIVAMGLEATLLDLGCKVAGIAVDIDEAMGMIDSVAIDAAVLDINLNGKKSYPVADLLALRGIPFVFATGYDDVVLVNRYSNFRVLQKPYREIELSRALEEVLAGKSCVES